jgi:hypothetical protein
MEGDFNPTTDTMLPPGIHNFGGITIRNGVTVRPSGPGPFELRATGPVRIDGVVDASGADGGPIASTCMTVRHGSSGGSTGIPGAGASSASCPAGVASLGASNR